MSMFFKINKTLRKIIMEDAQTKILQLKTWRKNISVQNKIPLHFIVSNKVIENIAEQEPKNIAELNSIKGIGLKKINKYGIEILNIIYPEHSLSQDNIDDFIEKNANKKRLKKSKSPSLAFDINVIQKENIKHENLSDEQKLALHKFKDGENLFITGPAGSGKSYLISEIINESKTMNKRVQCCAMTGCAAVLLQCQAKTIHSWAGIGIASGTDTEIINSIIMSSYKCRNWKSVDVLIIDEVSMMSSRLFCLLDKIAKVVRYSTKPFGGIQVILSGDFYQLPPIHSGSEELEYCFESQTWKETISSSILLKKIFRQNEPQFTKILGQIRKGRISKKTYEILSKCVHKDRSFTDISPTIILPRKRQAELINKRKLKELNSREYTYDAYMGKCLTEKYSEKAIAMEFENLTKNSLFEKKIVLKKGAQVMCISNIDLDLGICNGSVGIVESFSTTNNPIVKFLNGITMEINPVTWKSESLKGVYVQQIPLILAWSCTVHKIQGATLDCIDVDVGSGIFEYGQTYVALSRVKSLAGLYLRSFNPHKIIVHPKVSQFYSQLQL